MIKITTSGEKNSGDISWYSWNDPLWNPYPILPYTITDANSAMKSQLVIESQDDKSYIVLFCAPGLNEKDFILNVVDNWLTISVPKKKESNGINQFAPINEGKTFIPNNVDVESGEAEYKSGVLKVTFKKIQPKKINIKVK